ncbi:F-box domain-containing protein [Mycena sanguinolenta]|uniref:F-box domain-containing protein n=1 Tax=Mycena sanguinolenta TaxID=230812 RepID=A0A8H6YTG5_9AGAR|nr:F-box domain-containing protein [Mycena sanguinolenta]
MTFTFTFSLPEPPIPPDHLVDLLNSNALPSSIESRHTISYIDELESQVSMLDKAMEPIQLRRAELMQTVKTYKSILSPIRCIPFEILGEIFSLVVRETFRKYARLPVTQHAPWLFTRVSRYWSAVALGTPALWSMIFVDEGYRGQLPLTELCLARSRNVPLNVKILYNRQHNAHVVEVLDVLLSLSDRWRTAELIVDSFSATTCKLLQRLTRINGLSSLKTLVIDLDTPDQDSACFWDDRSLRRAPFSFPWHQLTRVRTTTASNIQALSLLGKLPNIVECKIGFEKIKVLPAHSRVIHLPYLRTLVLQLEDHSGDGLVEYEKHTSLLDFLETPCLQSLTTHEIADEDDVTSLITRSDCAATLTSFRFHLSSIDQEKVLELVLETLPHLTLLRVEDFDGGLLPRTPMEVPAFVRVFVEDWVAGQAASPLRQSLHVRLVDGQLDDGKARLSSFADDSLFITVSSTPHWPSVIADGFHYVDDRISSRISSQSDDVEC